MLVVNKINDLDTLKVFLITKYVNPDFSVSDLTCKAHSKIEYSHIDELILYYLKKNFVHFQVLEVLGVGTDTRLSNAIKKVDLVLSKKVQKDILNETLIQEFIFDFKIDLKEINSLTLNLLNNLIQKL